MMGSLGMMAGNPLSAMQSLMAMRAPGLDMSNPVIAQLMMQQVSVVSLEGSSCFSFARTPPCWPDMQEGLLHHCMCTSHGIAYNESLLCVLHMVPPF